MTKNTLDLTAVWNDAMALLSAHKEAAIAIAGVFLFLPSWMFAYFVGEPDTGDATDPSKILDIMLQFYSENSLALIIVGLLTSFGTLAYYVILVRKDYDSIGAGIARALPIFPIFFIASIITGLLTGLGAFAFIIGAFYLTGRFSAVAGVVAAEPERGIIGSIKYGWSLTDNVGWMAFLIIFIVSIVGSVISFVIGLIFTLLSSVAGGQLLVTAVTSLIGAVFSVVIATLVIAIYRHLKPQVDGNIAKANPNQE